MRSLDVKSAHLVNRHLPKLQVGLFKIVPEVDDFQLAVEFVLPREPGGVDGLEALEKYLLSGLVLQDGLLGVASQLVVVPLVANDGRKYRVLLKVVFPVLGPECPFR